MRLLDRFYPTGQRSTAGLWTRFYTRVRAILWTGIVAVAEWYDYVRLRLQGYRVIGRPYAVIEVDPDAVSHMISSSKFGRDVPRFGVVGGDWDERAYPFEQNAVYEMFEQHFLEGVPWERTTKYHQRVEQLERGESIPELDGPEQSVDAYDAYLEYWDEVFEDIEESGYRSQRELRQDHDFASRIPSPLREIEVLIGRDGRLICNAGKHRLTIAKLLDLESVPVRVPVRHEEWQQIRESVATADNEDDLPSSVDLSHPDLKDVAP